MPGRGGGAAEATFESESCAAAGIGRRGCATLVEIQEIAPMPPRLAAVLTAFAVVASATASTVGSIERFDWSRRQMRSSGT